MESRILCISIDSYIFMPHFQAYVVLIAVLHFCIHAGARMFHENIVLDLIHNFRFIRQEVIRWHPRLTLYLFVRKRS